MIAPMTPELKRAQRNYHAACVSLAELEGKLARIELAVLDTQCGCECSHVNGHQDIGYDDECGPLVCLRCRIQEILRNG
jgi:hypothetical protein